jgi:predicted ATPase
MIHLRSIRFEVSQQRNPDHFPFNLPVLNQLDELDVNAPVTIFVGENGSGKSTLMEALACKLNIIVAGSESGETDPSLNEVRPLSKCLSLAWNQQTRKGFFLRAEDYFGYVKQLHQMRVDLEADLEQAQHDLKDRSPAAKMYGQGPYRKELNGLKTRNDGDLDQRSHGESFLDFFHARVLPDGLYLLDEPEAALSPMRQLSLISLIKAMSEQGAQFIIATHSPILLAIPDAVLLSFDHNPIQPIEYDELEHVRLMRSFLDTPEQYLRHL